MQKIKYEKVPKLRFKEFTSTSLSTGSGEWVEKKLKEITSYVDYRGRAPIKTDSGYFLVTAKNIKQGYIDYECSKEYVGGDNYFNVMSKGLPKIGDVLFTTEAPMGNVAQVNDVNIALAQRVIKFRGNDYLKNNFLKHYMMGYVFQKSLLSHAFGSTVLGIQGKILHNLKLNLPTLPEQQKIADCLSTWDDSIENLKSLIENKKLYKKGMMQKLFSQELRFKEDDGSKFPEWQEKKLGEVSECLDNLRKPLNDSERQKMQGNIPYWGANNIMDHINDYIFDETIVLLAEDGGNFSEYRTRPIANLSKGKCWVNNHTHVLIEKKNISKNEFLFYSLVHKNITGYVGGGTRSKLTKSEMLKIGLKIPCLPEQTKIANFLSAIDEEIELLEHELEQLQLQKKGLMQGMFV